MAQLVAGVDSSTQSCKVLIVDPATGEIVRQGRAAHPDGTEVAPSEWWRALGEALDGAGGLSDVGAISIGGQQHGLVALDAAGHVVRDALLWNDTRSAQAAADLTTEVGAADFATRTGLVPVASFTITKLRWLRDAEPDNAARVAAVALPHDWLSWRLRGYGPEGESPLGPDLDALATDRSDASGTGYFDPTTDQYDSGLFELAFGRPLRVAGSDGTPAAVVVPRVTRYDQQLGALDRDVTVGSSSLAPAGLRIGAGAGDNAAAALGLQLGAGDIAVSLGTSGTVFGVSETATSDETGTVAGFADATTARLPIVTTLNAARVLDVFAGVLEVDYDELGTLALQAPPGSDGLVLVPYFVGERTPNRPEATASLTGMTPRTMSRPHLARAAIEGMLCSLADGLAAIEATGTTVERLFLIGGAAQNSAVRAIAAQVFGRDITVPEAGEYVALGAAVQAAWLLTGSRPTWELASVVIAADPHPGVLESYRAAGSLS
ncbi:xylulokinase [Frondihabitans sp. VKM Ac-2883]|uniref:xylulokinase n=1 Tax=Frondihabitans sp. VKM Ac-2883 TaxID=2783823 RepID=UPI00188D5252|nr:xylulokinase [Frondihabitans sp. VKM Ac-2883]MBF4575404.1 xylulokinase [Frondihabitans sp. VKM Ac-2883]